MNHRPAFMILASMMAFGGYAMAGDSNMTMTHMTMAQKRQMMSDCMAQQKAKDSRESKSHMKMVCKKEMKMRQMKMQTGQKTGMQDSQSSSPPK